MSGRLSPKSEKKIKEKRQKEKEELIQERLRKKREELIKTKRKTYYEYQAQTPGIMNICLTAREMTDVLNNIPELSESNFKRVICDPDSKYNIESCPNLRNRAEFKKAYKHFLNKYKTKEYLKVAYNPDITEEVDLEYTFRLCKKTFENIYITERFLNLLKTQKNDTIIVANVNLDYITGGHRILLEITKNINNIYITIIDTGCNFWYRDATIEVFKNIYYEQLKYTKATLKFIFEFNNYIANKTKSIIRERNEKITPQNYKKIFDELCKYHRIQLGEEDFFNIGFCVSWGLYFIYQIYNKGISPQSLYEDVFNMVNRKKFIYIWHDVLYDHVLKEIEKIKVKEQDEIEKIKVKEPDEKEREIEEFERRLEQEEFERRLKEREKILKDEKIRLSKLTKEELEKQQKEQEELEKMLKEQEEETLRLIEDEKKKRDNLFKEDEDW
jgi:hypothetical protein